MAHDHHAGGILMLDTLAAHSGLRGVSPAVKAAFSVAALVICVGAADPVVGIFVALSMILLMAIPGRVPPHEIAVLLRMPLLFLTVSCLVILLEISREPLGLWHLALGKHFLCITPDSARHALTLFFQAMGAVCCLYFLSSSTPMPQLIEVLRACHVPELMIELMYLIYRYLFLLLDVQQKLTVAASARLGYQGVRRSVRTAGRISGTLLASSFRRSSQCFDAMESRGYDGQLRFLSRVPPASRGQILAASAYILALCILVLYRKGWL